MEFQIILQNKKLSSFSKERSVSDINGTICEQTGLNIDEFYLLQNGKRIQNDYSFTTNNVYICLRQIGGKGGFGSMLRAIGAQIEKTTNREACRDLSGRRLRDINEEKRLKAWLEKQKNKEAEAEEKKRKKLEKLLAVPKHEFKDSKYEAARSELTEKVSEAVEEGFKKATVVATTSGTSMKRKAIDNGNQKCNKKAALWIDDALDDSNESTDDSSDSDEENNSKSSKNIKINAEGESSVSLQSSFTESKNITEEENKEPELSSNCQNESSSDSKG